VPPFVSASRVEVVKITMIPFPGLVQVENGEWVIFLDRFYLCFLNIEISYTTVYGVRVLKDRFCKRENAIIGTTECRPVIYSVFYE